MKRPKHPGPYPGEFLGSVINTARNRAQFYKWTGEQPRAILRGEFYLSGCDEHGSPAAYRAPSDLSGPFFPAVPIVLTECPCCHGAGKVEAR